MTGIGSVIIAVIISFLLFLGSIFILVGSIGLVRFPDIYCRLHAATKGATLGMMSIMLASIIFFYVAGLGFSARNLLVIVFIMLTNPVGAHMIAKASYHYDVELWTGSISDEWGGQ